MNDLINLMEWNQFAEDRKTLLEALTILNNRHREAVGKLEFEIAAMRDAIREAHATLLRIQKTDCPCETYKMPAATLSKLQPFLK